MTRCPCETSLAFDHIIIIMNTAPSESRLDSDRVLDLSLSTCHERSVNPKIRRPFPYTLIHFSKVSLNSILVIFIVKILFPPLSPRFHFTLLRICTPSSFPATWLLPSL